MATNTGRFVWHELHTTDRVKAQKFYAQLLGWQVKEESMGPGEPYGVCFLDGKDHAGITKSMAPPQVPSHWLPYIGVPDVDQYVAKLKGLGGEVRMEAMNIPNIGRFAVVADPQGAPFALFKGAKPDPEEPAAPPVGAFCWEELMTSDPAAAATFYAKLFDYTIDEVSMGPEGTYRLYKRGDRQTGGITTLAAGVTHAHWLTYLHVKDVDASTRNARELGAKVIVEPRDIPNVGRFSAIDDPTGAGIALFKGKM
jgi:predicted enzyme related to lactoylglutathione lyase